MSLDVTLISMAPIPTLTFGLDTAGGFRVALEMRMIITPPSIRWWIFVQFFFIDYISPDICWECVYLIGILMFSQV